MALGSETATIAQWCQRWGREEYPQQTWGQVVQQQDLSCWHSRFVGWFVVWGQMQKKCCMHYANVLIAASYQAEDVLVMHAYCTSYYSVILLLSCSLCFPSTIDLLFICLLQGHFSLLCHPFLQKKIVARSGHCSWVGGRTRCNLLLVCRKSVGMWSCFELCIEGKCPFCEIIHCGVC